MEKKTLAMRIAATILTACVIFYFSTMHFPFLNRIFVGLSCGCVPRSPGDCAFNLGFPFTYYSSGTKCYIGPVSYFSKIGFMLDVIVWLLCVRQIFKIKQKMLFWIISLCVVTIVITFLLHHYRQATTSPWNGPGEEQLNKIDLIGH